MPQQIFAPRISGELPSLELIDRLAGEFLTTLTATAVQFVRATNEECAIVSCTGRQRLWAVKSLGFSFHLSEDGYVHGCSCAAEAMKSGQPRRASDVEASFWLDGFRGDHKALITEDARVFSQPKTELSPFSGSTRRFSAS